ncbi:MAG TPA: mechanosensitive ion channel family protein [Vicinamibacterales bacterium]|nr:mechanosensitive ion channel family protein [Vicinamibacterales bacterium]
MWSSVVKRAWILSAVCGLLLVAAAAGAGAQTIPGTAPPAIPPATVEPPADPLGRTTPRGTVLGFLEAARTGNNELARQYLSSRPSGKPAETLAYQLFVVLDARLPARLTQISDVPEGSRSNPLRLDEERIGTVRSASGDIEIVVERVRRGKDEPIWLFSGETLAAIPALYEEVAAGPYDRFLPRSLAGARVGGVRVVEWLLVLLVIPIAYLATVLLNRILVPIIRPLWRRAFGESGGPVETVLPAPARLLILAIVGRLFLSSLPLSLLVRQFWTNAAGFLIIAAIAWLLIRLGGEVEAYVLRHMRAKSTAASSLVRLVRRAVDTLIVFAGLVATLRFFGIDPTPALAGLGVGGIAVALAAQKTLENVIAGASLIFDQAVRVGDFLRMGEISGTVEHIGLRSTRIRTLDRTVVSVPNSQIANASLETMSARDKYWFHPVVGLSYETTPEQLHAVVEGIRSLLETHPLVDRESIRVRFFRLGPFSLDVDVFAYLYARDWNHFLELQEELLFGTTETVHRTGTSIAFPSQTMYVKGAQVAPSSQEALPGV